MDAPDFSKTEDFKGVACVFFGPVTNSCSVYEYRPMACRLSTSMDSPKKYETEEFRHMIYFNHLLIQILMFVGRDLFPSYEASRENMPPVDIRKFFSPDYLV